VIPVAPVRALFVRTVVGSAAERIDLGTHERLDEGLKQRARHIGVRLPQVLAQERDEVHRRRRRWWSSW